MKENHIFTEFTIEGYTYFLIADNSVFGMDGHIYTMFVKEGHNTSSLVTIKIEFTMEASHIHGD